MADIRWYQLYEKDTGRAYATASIDLEDEDTAVDESGQPYSLSGLRGIAHPDVLAERGLEAKELGFNPQEEPPEMKGGRYEWDNNQKAFIPRSETELMKRRLQFLKDEVAKLEVELGQ